MRASLVMLAWGFLLGVVHGADSERPNFVLIIADDVSPDDLGTYGGKAKTPQLDALAKSGLRCDRAFLTCSSCSPSRCSLITGRYPHQTGAAELHQPLPAEQVTFTQLLRDQGYYVAAAGKWHLGEPTKTKFDKVVGGQPSGCEQWVKTLAERPQDKPFCLWLAALDAHRDYQPQSLPNVNDAESIVVPPFLPDQPEVRRDLANYADEISRLDGFVGKVLKELDRQGVADNTLVLFMADNGRPFPRCKTTLYDSGIRTPLLVRWPATIKPGQASKSLISTIDIAPTLLELAGIAPPKTFVGRSFAKLLERPDSEHRDAIFAEHHWHDYSASERAVRTERYLYIRNALPQFPRTPPADAVRSPTYALMEALHAKSELPAQQATCFISPAPREELYDLEADPHSLLNLAAAMSSAAVLAEMRQRLDRWSTETGDVLPQEFTPDKYDRTTGKTPEK